MIWVYVLISVILVSLLSLIGLVFLGLDEKKLKKILLLLVGFSAGALLGDAFIHLIPETIKKNGFTIEVSLSILGGVILFFVLEQFISWRHCHDDTEGKCHSFAYMNLIGDGLHNFLDGVTIAASYLADIKLGMITTLAIILHEIPQEIGDFGVLLHGGFTKTKALMMNLLTAITAILGAILFLIIGTVFTNSIDIFLLITAGGFIYIAMTDLIPELHRNRKGFAELFMELIFFLLGIGVMLMLLVLN